MPRFYGEVGFLVTTEKARGVFVPEHVKRMYSGDIIRMTSQWENGEGLNDDLRLGNRISLVGDPFAYEHFSSIKYVKFGGASWKVNSVEVSYPRLILSIGGVYNGVDDSTGNSGST